MDRDEAIKLLRGGEEGVKEWNEWRREGEELPDLSGADLRHANLNDANLSHANLSGANLSRANLRDANLSFADLSGANLSGADLSGANLRVAHLRRANLSGANLSFADLSGANLSGEDLSDAKLSGANLSFADLSDANLSGANLSGAKLSGAGLSGAGLTDANLSHANLSGAHLRSANLRSANLHDANLRSADLSDANLSGADLGFTTLAACDLSAVLNLDTATHTGPSTVGLDTCAMSKGRIADEFLRGCGLTPWEVLSTKLYRPDIKPVEFAELQNLIFDARVAGPIGGVFISYAHKDEAFVDRLQEQMQGKDISVWRDVHDLVAGPIVPQVMNAVRMRDVVVVVLSEAALASDWVEHEVEAAREREKKEDRPILCPVALDDSWKKKQDPLWTKLRRDKVILPFDDSHDFDEQFAKLLKGMKIFYGPDAGDPQA